MIQSYRHMDPDFAAIRARLSAAGFDPARLPSDDELARRGVGIWVTQAEIEAALQVAHAALNAPLRADELEAPA